MVGTVTPPVVLAVAVVVVLTTKSDSAEVETVEDDEEDGEGEGDGNVEEDDKLLGVLALFPDPLDLIPLPVPAISLISS